MTSQERLRPKTVNGNRGKYHAEIAAPSKDNTHFFVSLLQSILYNCGLFRVSYHATEPQSVLSAPGFDNAGYLNSPGDGLLFSTIPGISAPTGLICSLRTRTTTGSSSGIPSRPQNGQAADLSIGNLPAAPSGSGFAGSWPWAVWTEWNETGRRCHPGKRRAYLEHLPDCQ